MNDPEFWLLMAACIVLLIIIIWQNHRLSGLEEFCGLLCAIAFSDGDLKDLKKHGYAIDLRDDQSERK